MIEQQTAFFGTKPSWVEVCGGVTLVQSVRQSSERLCESVRLTVKGFAGIHRLGGRIERSQQSLH